MQDRSAGAPAARAFLRRSAAPLRTFRDKLLAGAFWNILGTVAWQGSMLLTTMLLANLLGIAEFGGFALLLSTVVAVTTVSQGGVGILATKYVAELRLAHPLRAGRVIGLCRAGSAMTGVLASILVAVLAPVIAVDLMDQPALAPLIVMFSPYVLFSVLNIYQVGVLHGFGAFRHVTKYGALHGVAHLAGCASATAAYGLDGAIVAFVVSSILRWLLFAHLMRHVVAGSGIRPSLHDAWGELRRLRDFAVPAALSCVVMLPAIWVPNLLLARLPAGTEEIGAYHAANQLRLLALQLPLMLNSVAVSVLNQQRGQGDHQGYKDVFWANLWVTVSAGAITVLLLGVFSNDVLGLFGRDFARAQGLLLILLAAAMLEIIAAASYQHMQAHARMWPSLFAIVIPRDGALVGLSWLLAERFGALGVGWAYLCAASIACVSTLLITRRIGMKERAHHA
jgi:O-antigen/teichoic acid export membrane protein